MNKWFSLFLLLFSVSTTSYAIQVDVSSYSFYGQSAYVEAYIRIEGSSVQWKIKNNKYSSSIQCVVYLTDEKGEIVGFDNLLLQNLDSDSIVDFLTVKRLPVKGGKYTLKIETTDQNNPTDKFELEQYIEVDEIPANPYLSDILLLGIVRADSTASPLNKHGIYMEPLAYHFSSEVTNQLNFYVEVYRKQQYADSTLLLQYEIFEGGSLGPNSKALMTLYKKLDTQTIQPLVLSIPVREIPSGNFTLLVSLLTKSKIKIFETKTSFARSNPEMDIVLLEKYNDKLETSFVQNIKASEMDFVLKAHVPITKQTQNATLGQLISSTNLKSQRQFIYQYWKKQNPQDPEGAYKAYMQVAKVVDKQFQTNAGYGFQSDRGHMFLKYGKPTNVITVDSEIDAPPYEIWYYYKMQQTTQTNVRFIFYNPSLVHNDFKLLHSTCLGERSNPAWEVTLYGSVPNDRIGNTIDATTVKDNFNRNARRYFNEY